jgi:hypothetical protein
MQPQILSKVFLAFIESNDFGIRTCEDLFTHSQAYDRFYLRYQFDMKTYIATIQWKSYSEGPLLEIVLTNPISMNTMPFASPNSKRYLSRDSSNLWQRLTEKESHEWFDDILLYFRRQAPKLKYNKYKIFLNVFLHLLEIKLFSSSSGNNSNIIDSTNQNQNHNLVIRFEHHYPIEDDTAEGAFSI